ncbi:hypothetical protein ACFVJH_34805 [Streptomyces decoyicus]|uniref:hypothetical protein n=1 Tax=Streptomyces decoyicus TaxID=249567 RepID=UPI00363490F7
MKISTACRAALLAACALTVLAPTQALAAQSPACPNKAVAYLNAQDKQEDTEAAVDTAQRAYNEAKDDQAKLGKTVDTGGKLLRTFHDIHVDSRPVYDAIIKLDKAAQSGDAAATADAAVAEADAAQKVLDGARQANSPHEEMARTSAKGLIERLRSDAETARKAILAKDVPARKTALDKAISDKAAADKDIRPKRDAYRDCLAKSNG